jgi:hypothetical protein
LRQEKAEIVGRGYDVSRQFCLFNVWVRRNMKKILTLTALMGTAVLANAQSFTESFDTVTFTTGSPATTNATNLTAGNFAGDTVNGDVTWVAINQSVGGPGLTGWFNTSAQSTPVWAPQAGAGQVNANFNAATGANNIDLYLISPQRTFNNGDTISFWTRTVSSPAYPDRLFLKLSTAGAATATSNFTTTLLSVNPSLTTSGYPSVYTLFTATISGLAGPTSGRFAFNYNVTNGGPSGSISDFIGIDTIRYTAVPEPMTISAMALGVAAMLRRRRSSK